MDIQGSSGTLARRIISGKDIFLQAQTQRLKKWKFNQHAKQDAAMTRLRACYDLGNASLLANGSISAEDAEKWRTIDSELLSLQENPKELLWYSRRRISRDYASSQEGLGKYPKSADEDE